MENQRKTKLVKIDSNPVSPKTEIEDSLNGKQFYDTLLEFKNEYPELESVLNDIEEPSEDPTFFAFDLAPSKYKILDNFFNMDNNKFDFAKKYIEKLDSDYSIPDWIEDLKSIY